MGVPDDRLGKLIERGREQGHLTLEEIKDALPVEAMSEEEIASAISRLEDAGVNVELEPELELPRAVRPEPVPAPAPTVDEEAWRVSPVGAGQDRAVEGPQSQSRPEPGAEPEVRASLSMLVVWAALGAIALLIILWLILFA